MTNQQDQQIVQDLAHSLQVTSALMQNLLNEMRDNSTSLAVLKEKLETLKDHVDSLSDIVRNGNGKGSLVTRLALAEQSLNSLEVALEELNDQLENRTESAAEQLEREHDFEHQAKLGRLKIAAVAIPGFVSLAILLLKMLSVGE